MLKTLNKYLRKYHRWLSLPFIVTVILVALTKDTPAGDVIQRIQQITMMTMVVTGLYLFLLPYLSKWQRRQKRNTNKRASIQTRPVSS
jgi:hypothetical protein